jgi:hypothetical protein
MIPRITSLLALALFLDLPGASAKECFASAILQVERASGGVEQPDHIHDGSHVQLATGDSAWLDLGYSLGNGGCTLGRVTILLDGNTLVDSPMGFFSVPIDRSGTYEVQTSSLMAIGSTFFTLSTQPVLTLDLHVKAYLQGAHVGEGLMHDRLRAQSLLPALTYIDQTAFSAPFSVFQQTGPNAIVDWVVLEVRPADDPTARRIRRAVLLQRDGDVVATDGTSPVTVQLETGNYHVSLRHRNHLGVMTATSVPVTGGSVTLDFSDPGLATHGTDARVMIGGKAFLRAGNARSTPGAQRISYTGESNDRDAVLSAIGGVVPTNTVSGYRIEDLNLDGVVKYVGEGNDRDVVLSAIGGVVPTAIRSEQLP